MPQYGEERAAVTSVALYGANASGKSNVLSALQFVQGAVRDSYQRWSPNGGIPRQPFRLDKRCLREPSWYVIEVLIDGVRWTYGFELDDESVRAEWLYSYPQHRRRVVFERDGDGIRFGSTVTPGRDRRRVLEGLTRRNALFLSLGAQVGLDETMPMYSWLDERLVFAPHTQKDQAGRLADFLSAHPERRDEILALVGAADLGISGIDLRTVPDSRIADAERAMDEARDLFRRSGHPDPEQDPAFARLLDRQADLESLYTQSASVRLRLAHGTEQTLFDPHEESAGTMSWMGLLPLVLDALRNGDTLAVDELDASLHPRLAARVVELFRNPATNTGRGQLVFTTHDATLLGTSLGEPVLARDEIWFVAKDPAGASSVFPLSDFKPRKGENTERRYLGGSYGAVPAVFSDTLVDELLRARGRADAAS